MKTVMVLGVHDENHPFVRALRGTDYHVVTGGEPHELPLTQTGAHVLMESDNREEVLQKARFYAVDGILGVGEKAMLAAAYAAQQLGLPGIRYAEEELFHNLFHFREFQLQNGLRVPRYRDISHRQEPKGVPYPMYVGPADGHVLRDTMRVTCPEEFAAARRRALQCSPRGLAIAQEDLYALPGHEHAMLLMSDLIVRDEILQPIVWCEALRSHDTADLMPCGGRYPARIDYQSRKALGMMCAHLVDVLQIQNAQIPVLVLNVPGSVPYLLRIGVRDGSYLTTRFLSMLYGRDLLLDAIRMSVGDRLQPHYRYPPAGTYMAYYTVSAYRTGILRHISMHPRIRSYEHAYVSRGQQSQQVNGREGTGEILDTIILRFPNEAVMDEILGQMSSLIDLKIDNFDEWW